MHESKRVGEEDRQPAAGGSPVPRGGSGSGVREGECAAERVTRDSATYLTTSFHYHNDYDNLSFFSFKPNHVNINHYNYCNSNTNRRNNDDNQPSTNHNDQPGTDNNNNSSNSNDDNNNNNGSRLCAPDLTASSPPSSDSSIEQPSQHNSSCSALTYVLPEDRTSDRGRPTGPPDCPEAGGQEQGQ